MAAPRQLTSTVEDVSWSSAGGQEVVAAHVYFATDQHGLTRDDTLALRRLTASLEPVLTHHGTRVDVRCDGWADPRGTDAYNLALSQRRCEAVAAFLEQELQAGPRRAAFAVSRAGHGERAGGVDRGQYDAERRVEVVVKVTRPSGPPARVLPLPEPENPWPRKRASLFRTYAPAYPLWLRLGLDHLVDEYELHEEDDRPVRWISPADRQRVLALLEARASPEVVLRLRREASEDASGRVLADAYNVEYRRAYHEAYQRSPGALLR